MKKLWKELTSLIYGIPPGYKVLIFFVFIIALLIYFSTFFESEPEVKPCDDIGFPARCYYVPIQSCDLIWAKAELTCKETLKSLNLPPGKLVGPFLSKCQLMHFDKAFTHNRKSNSECGIIFKSLDEWKQQNKFK